MGLVVCKNNSSYLIKKSLKTKNQLLGWFWTKVFQNFAISLIQLLLLYDKSRWKLNGLLPVLRKAFKLQIKEFDLGKKVA